MHRLNNEPMDLCVICSLVVLLLWQAAFAHDDIVQFAVVNNQGKSYT